MARYGTFLYDGALYGAAGNLSSSGIRARAVDYDTVTLSISSPDRVGKSYILIRSYNGAAEYPNEGLVISAGTLVDAEFTLDDTAATSGAQLIAGWCYYTLFVVDNYSWVKDAATSVLVPADRGTYQYLMENLPSIFTSAGANPLENVDYDGVLARFLKGFALSFDEWAMYVDTLLPDHRGDEVVRRLDPTRALSVGMPNEYTIGTAAAHRLFNQAGFIYKNKGSVEGIAAYVKALTGWETFVQESSNLILSLDDSSFEDGIGNWTTSDVSMSSVTADGVIVTSCDIYDAQSGPTYDFKRDSVAEVVLTDTTGFITLPTDNVLLAIPLPHGTAEADTFTFTVPAKAVVGTPDVTATIVWVSSTGGMLGGDTSAALTTSGSWDSATVTSAVPAGAKYAVLSVGFSGSVSDTVHLDMLYFGVDESPWYYKDARSVDIVCNPVLVNQALDPSFDDAGLTYIITDSGTASVTTDEYLEGVHSLKLEGPFVVHHNRMSVEPGEYYTVRVAAKGTGSLDVYVEWLNDAMDSTLSDAVQFSLSSDWVVGTGTFLSPSDTSSARIYFEGDDTAYIDTLVFSNASKIETFFSGAVGDSAGEDTYWYGTPAESISVLYPRRLTKLSRLLATLDYYLPFGVTYRLLLWGDSPTITSAVDFVPQVQID